MSGTPPEVASLLASFDATPKGHLDDPRAARGIAEAATPAEGDGFDFECA